MKKKLSRGAVTIIFLVVVALVLTLLLAATQSRLLLSLRRSQSAADSLIANYEAESEVNDIMARLVNGYLGDANIPRTTKTVGDMRIEYEGQDLGDTQIITVTAFRGFAVGKVQAVRRIQSVEEVNEVELILGLDCTSSMDARDAVAGCSGSSCPSRFNALEDAAIDFIDNIAALEPSEASKFKLGVAVFGKDSAWMKYNGVDVTPANNLSFGQIADAIEGGFGNNRRESSACGLVQDGTSVGTAFRHGHDYLANTKEVNKKQVEIVITDGVPNSRIDDAQCPQAGSCGPFPECTTAAKNYLRCTLADSSTFVSEIGQNGVRDPEVNAYSVTILANPPADVPPIFQKYGTENGYFNTSRAGELGGILDQILTKILEDRSSITIKRVIPTPQ